MRGQDTQYGCQQKSEKQGTGWQHGGTLPFDYLMTSLQLLDCNQWQKQQAKCTRHTYGHDKRQ
jgi:hypothetical protein